MRELLRCFFIRHTKFSDLRQNPRNRACKVSSFRVNGHPPVHQPLWPFGAFVGRESSHRPKRITRDPGAPVAALSSPGMQVSRIRGLVTEETVILREKNGSFPPVGHRKMRRQFKAPTDTGHIRACQHPQPSAFPSTETSPARRQLRANMRLIAAISTCFASNTRARTDERCTR